MEIIQDLLKANPLVIALIILLIIAIIIFYGVRGKWEIRITKAKSEAKDKEQDNELMAISLQTLSKITDVVISDRDKIANAVDAQSAMLDKMTDALATVKVGVDTLILEGDDAKRFREELRSTLARMADYDDTIKHILKKLDEKKEIILQNDDNTDSNSGNSG